MINCKGFTGFVFISENAKLKNSVNMLKMLRLGWMKQKQNSRARLNHLHVTLNDRQQLILKKG